jgi:CTP synthase (UTP-ammonia lyase)
MQPFTIGILGDLNETYEPYYVMTKVFRDMQQHIPFQFQWVPTESLIHDAPEALSRFQGIVAGSGPYRSKEGVINGIRYARDHNIPFLGSCSGFGYAVLEFGQAIFQLETVRHLNEDVPLAPNETFLQPLNFCSMENHITRFKARPGTITSLVYGHNEQISELTHCSYGVHRDMIPVFAREGLVVAAEDEDGEPKIMEYNRNDYFVIVLFLPQLQSTPNHPHPLIAAFVEAAASSTTAARSRTAGSILNENVNKW